MLFANGHCYSTTLVANIQTFKRSNIVRKSRDACTRNGGNDDLPSAVEMTHRPLEKNAAKIIQHNIHGNRKRNPEL